MECCGYDRVTPFCPMCGKIMNEKPIHSLLRHIRKYRDSIQEELDVNTRIHGEKIKDPDHESFRKSLNRRLGRWDAWHKALSKLISGDNQTNKEEWLCTNLFVAVVGVE